MLDFFSTEHEDLRSRASPWAAAVPDGREPAPLRPTDCDVLVVGGGITGALIAEHLTAEGRQVSILDREPPGLGSTAASTAMLQWEIDAPLAELALHLGPKRAASVYERSRRAVAGLTELAARLAIPCHYRPRPTLYLAAGEAGPEALAAEHALRRSHGLPGRLLDADDLVARFGIDRAAAILSPGSAEADPLRLAHGLLHAARGRGAALFAGEAVGFEPRGDRVVVRLADAAPVTARHVVLATGYVMPDFVPQHLHKVVATWALKTPPQEAPLWRDGALIWEASRSYIYARTTADGAIVIGGEDEAESDPVRRNAQTAAKTAALQRKLAALWPKARTDATLAWSGAFGSTEDGLPLIGPVPGMARVYAAYGYGGNGITFSFMASRMIAEMIRGGDRPWFRDFALDRPKA
jgi:glycine/D-amino acid oxidase-like deaminating enzyme